MGQDFFDRQLCDVYDKSMFLFFDLSKAFEYSYDA